MIGTCGCANPTDRTIQICVSLLERVLDHYHPRDFTIRLWDGIVWGPEFGHPARFTWVIRHPGAMRRMFWGPSQLSLAEACISGGFDIDGDLEQAVPLIKYLLHRILRLSDRLRYGLQVLRLPSDKPLDIGGRAATVTGLRHSLKRDKQARRLSLRPLSRILCRMARSTDGLCLRVAAADHDLKTAQTQKWRERFERNDQQVGNSTDDISYRIWRLYLASAAYGFQMGWLNVYQTLLSKPNQGRSGLPLTWEARYA